MGSNSKRLKVKKRLQFILFFLKCRQRGSGIKYLFIKQPVVNKSTKDLLSQSNNDPCRLDYCSFKFGKQKIFKYVLFNLILNIIKY